MEILESIRKKDLVDHCDNHSQIDTSPFLPGSVASHSAWLLEGLQRQQTHHHLDNTNSDYLSTGLSRAYTVACISFLHPSHRASNSAVI